MQQAPDPGCQPVPFALQPVLPLQKKMSVGDMNCPSFAGCSYTKEEKKGVCVLGFVLTFLKP